jgi:hypothetical protein
VGACSGQPLLCSLVAECTLVIGHNFSFSFIFTQAYAYESLTQCRLAPFQKCCMMTLTIPESCETIGSSNNLQPCSPLALWSRLCSG